MAGTYTPTTVPWWESFGTNLIDNVTETATTWTDSFFDGLAQTNAATAKDTDTVREILPVQGTAVNGSPVTVAGVPVQNGNGQHGGYVEPTVFGFPQSKVLLAFGGLGLTGLLLAAIKGIKS